MCYIADGVTGLIVNQESLWRHGVVHDPAKKKLKVESPCWRFKFLFKYRKRDSSVVYLVFVLRKCLFPLPEVASEKETALATGTAGQSGSCSQSNGHQQACCKAAQNNFRGEQILRLRYINICLGVFINGERCISVVLFFLSIKIKPR